VDNWNIFMSLKTYQYQDKVVKAYNKEDAHRKLERKFKMKVPYSELKNVIMLSCKYGRRKWQY
jgi:hypothetical protein